ncbi:MAG: Jag N-terminal domain-containing protein [Clostridia bacterium]|nr:Jag N-terminal domain-containing protein [Clostridia bacterium]
MKSIEITGKTVKEAVAKGCQELGCDSSDVEIQVLEMGTPGLFGLFGKPAKVRLTVKSKDDDLNIDLPKLSLDQPSTKAKSAPEKAKKENKPKAEKTNNAEKAEKAPKQEKTSEKEAEPSQPKSAKKRREPKPRNAEPKEEKPVETVPAPLPEPEPFVETPEDSLTDTAKDARAFLTGLVERMNVPSTIQVSEKPEQLRMVLSGENMSILIGRRGETLDALQYLTSLHVNRNRDEYIRVNLDTENYRARREEALRKLAVRMANRCKKNGRRVALEPMNPYERRILHSALQADPEVTTHSEGEEPYRRVIITLK